MSGSFARISHRSLSSGRVVGQSTALECVGLVTFKANEQGTGLPTAEIPNPPLGRRLATSADAIITLSRSADDDHDEVAAVVEIKTCTEATTEAAADARRRDALGEDRFIEVELGDAHIPGAIPRNHRAQLLHHAAVWGVDYALYVCAAASAGITYAVLVSLTVAHRRAYRNLIFGVVTRFFPDPRRRHNQRGRLRLGT